MELKDRIAATLEYTSLSASAFARKIGVKTSQAIYDLLSGKTQTLSSDILNKIVSYYPLLSVEWLMTGRGEMLKPNSKIKNPDNSQSTTSSVGRFVPLIPVEVFAGPIARLLSDGVSVDECRKIIAPMAGAEMAIPVSGDSMEPIIHDGAIIYIARINDRAFIPWGNIMVLDTENGALVKEVYPSPTDADAVQVRSINSKYPPYDVPKDSIRGIYRVLGFSKYYTTL